LSGAREEAVRAEERHEAARRRLADIGHEILEMLEVEPPKVAGLAGIEPDTALPEVAETEERLEKLRRDRERLGAVNLRAEEELREVETQLTSLTAERDNRLVISSASRLPTFTGQSICASFSSGGT
jgi:chromosome segregation protein